MSKVRVHALTAAIVLGIILAIASVIIQPLILVGIIGICIIAMLYELFYEMIGDYMKGKL